MASTLLCPLQPVRAPRAPVHPIRRLVGLLVCLVAALPAEAQPINDDCASAELIACNSSTVFDSSGASQAPLDPAFSCRFLGPGNGFATMWFKFVAADTSAMLTTCVSAEVTDTLVGVYAVANASDPCASLVEIGCSEDAGCGPLGRLSRACVENLTIGNTYYVQVAGFGPNDLGLITLDVTCPCPAGDLCGSAQWLTCNQTISLDSTFASESAFDPVFVCAGTPGSATLWFRFVATDTSAFMMTCHSAGVTDTILGLYAVGNPQDPCGSLAQIACSDDACGPTGLRSELCASGLTVGATYYIEVAGFNPGNRGALTLDLSCPCVPDCVPCPPPSVPEGEPVCANGYIDQFNIGCSANPPLFAPIACGQVVCGTSGTFLRGDNAPQRDTDWYEFTLVEERQVTFAVTAEFPATVFIIDLNPTCANRIFRATGLGRACDQIAVSACLGPGTHLLFVAPTVFDNVPCGQTYTARLTCTCTCPGDMNGDRRPDGADIQPFVNCALTGNVFSCCACADINGNGQADADDIAQFTAAVAIGTACP